MAASASPITERTTFEGRWDDDCPHCGRKQREHMISHGPFEGKLYEHRLPCEPELVKKNRERRRLVRAGNWIVTGIDLVSYGISRVPFLEETRLAHKIFKRHLGNKLNRRKADETKK